LSALIGLAEDLRFDAKRYPAYDATTPVGRWEIAKDISSFANGQGGYIVIGLTTIRNANDAREVVSGLDLHPENSVLVSQISGVAKAQIYPPIRDLDVRWVADDSTSQAGVTVVIVPAQTEDKKLFVMLEVMEGQEQLRHIVIGIAERRGSDSVPMDGKAIQRALRDGLSSGTTRLIRIESKLDELLALGSGKSSVQVDTSPEQLEEIIKKLMES
jgi:predicted HTH transcriptional regulator